MRDRALAQLKDRIGILPAAQPDNPTIGALANRQRELGAILPLPRARDDIVCPRLAPRDALQRIGDDASLGDLIEGFEKEALQRALESTHGNRAKAARLLGTTERIFNYRVRKYGIDWRSYRK
jgi:transcriptional regulator with GAF, ATPase, and Fis domain